MTNRVTDQTTQNALIKKFKLEGLLAELSVLNMVLPTVQVATLSDAQNVSEFEKWRSVLQNTPIVNNPAGAIFFNACFTTAQNNIADDSNMYSGFDSNTVGGNTGVKLPGADVGVAAEDGIYRISISCALNSAAKFQGEVELRDQAAFGAAVALGTLRGKIGNWQTPLQGQNNGICWDRLVRILKTDIANAVIFSNDFGTAGAGAFDMVVTKMIDLTPPFVIFPNT